MPGHVRSEGSATASLGGTFFGGETFEVRAKITFMQDGEGGGSESAFPYFLVVLRACLG